MYVWLLIGVVVLVVAVLIWKGTAAAAATVEGMTVDVDTLKAQRQLLQMEGERRYNDLARLQNPQTNVSADSINAAIAGAVPIPTTAKASLLSLVGSSGGLGAADDGSGKAGAPQEQTGVLQEKINFCESLATIDCNMLDDPRMAECGFCHRDGVDSKGKAHRGGMYISPDDQVRAAEINNRERETFAYDFGTAPAPKAQYRPTVGKCEPRNFTLVKEQCVARELSLKCQSAGAATAANDCGQCYGAAPAGATGLLFMGDNKRNPFNAYLYVSHPGFYPGPDGNSLTVTLPDGSTVGSTSSVSGTNLDPRQIPLTLKEADTLTIKINGMPPVWCAWLSDQSGKRTVSLDIGVQGSTPVDGIMIVGDKNSGPVKSALAGSDLGVFQSMFGVTVPNTVLWYGRRDELVSPVYVKAGYGTGQPGSGMPSVDITALLQQGIGTGSSVTVGPTLLDTTGQADPAPGATKYIWAAMDRSPQTFSIIAGDGNPLNLKNMSVPVVISFQMPATLVSPPLREDERDCPTGPIVTTEIGAGLMGSHSCFKPDGSFNPTQYCLQELFQAAGGVPQGSKFPNTDAKAAALVVNNSLDDTVAQLNSWANIALYGVDLNGAEVDFQSFKDKSLWMLGTTPKNPCDGPNASTGPHTPECLDYLWRTSGNPTIDNAPLNVDPSGLPYQFCSPGGLAAPLNADGSINAANAAAANALGSVSAIRGNYYTYYDRMKNSPDFDTQAAAMRNCLGTNVQPPYQSPGQCPPPNPTQWQCFSPQMNQQPEVFAVEPNGGYTVTRSNAEGVCSTYGARLASAAELGRAQSAGADWCMTAWVQDDNSARYPITTTLMGGCGGGNAGIMTWTPPGDAKGVISAGVNCYGVKPPNGTQDVLSFAPGVWNQPQTVAPGAVLSFSQGSGNGIRYLRHSNFQLSLDVPDAGPVPSPQMQKDSTFLISPANTMNSTQVSFQAVNFSGYYIRHENFRALLTQPDTPTFAADSSFIVGPALNGSPTQVSIQTSNFPGYYMVAVPDPSNPNSSPVYLVQQGAGNFSNDAASWTIHTPNSPGSSMATATQAVSAYREINGQVQCAADSTGKFCATYPDMTTCNSAVASMNNQTPTVLPPSDLASQIDSYFAARI
jgi:hypothetical protein